MMMAIIDTRFHDTITIREPDVITFDREVLGFPQFRRFVLLPHRPDSPFLYLQSTESPSLAFVTIDPLLREPEYTLPIDEIPGLGDPKDWAILCLCTLGPGHHGTINLRSPLVINRETRRGGQFVLSLPYPVHYPLFPDKPRATEKRDIPFSP